MLGVWVGRLRGHILLGRVCRWEAAAAWLMKDRGLEMLRIAVGKASVWGKYRRKQKQAAAEKEALPLPRVRLLEMRRMRSV